MSPEFLFKQFLNEKRFLNNASHNTILFYEQSFKTFNLQEPVSKSQLNERVASLRENGKSAACCNAYIRGINPFLTWMLENGYITEPLRVKSLKTERRVMKTLTDAQVKAIVTFRPGTFYERRLHTMLCLAIDTGIRINEALTLKRGNLDLENLLVTVMGKGNKERVVPVSIECRKLLFKFLQAHESELVFSTREGYPLSYDNTRRDFNRLMQRLGIDGFDGSFHALRRFFARSYVRNGGNVFYLQKMLGHTTLTMSRKYVEVETKDLQDTHLRTSILGRIRMS
ncbi:MAG: integrase/recombinase XerD [Blastocatellia bacterium]|jgi:integrase/recombinase XerD|nr:integrase/recombinase XerD [Blastocatellia bacterium]